MAIVNRTRDSFYDQGRTFALPAAVEAAEKAAQHGADWLDIGGVRFGPGVDVQRRKRWTGSSRRRGRCADGPTR